MFLTGYSVACYVCSLAPLTPLTPLTRSATLCFTTLALLACSVHGLAHSLCSLPHGTVEIHEETRYWSSLETRPHSAGFICFSVPTYIPVCHWWKSCKTLTLFPSISISFSPKLSFAGLNTIPLFPQKARYLIRLNIPKGWKTSTWKTYPTV